MRHLINTKTMALVVLLITFMSCKKNEVKKEEDKPKFDINNPIGYFIYLKSANDNGTWVIPALMEFRPGKTLKYYSSKDKNQIYPYEVIDGNTINIVGFNYRFVIENDKISTEVTRFKEIALLKAEETNQLAGKTFTGTYHQPDKSVLHQNFFYSFSANENKLGAGFKPDVVMRTENYTVIGNIAAMVDVAGNDDAEFMVLVNGKLEVGYYQDKPYSEYYGIFTQQ